MARIGSTSLARIARLFAVAVAAASLTQCGESGRYGVGPSGGGGGGGGTPGTPGATSCTASCPAVTINSPTVGTPVGVGDSVLLNFRVSDDVGVDSVVLEGFAQRGDVNLGTDTTVVRFTPRTIAAFGRRDTTLSRFLYVIRSDSTAELATIVVTAQDSAGNRGSASVQIRLSQGPKLTLVRPAAGAVSSVGKVITIQIIAKDPNGILFAGYRTTGVLTRSDTTVRGTLGSLQDSVDFTTNLLIPANTPVGQLIITAFAADSAGDPAASVLGTTVQIQSATSDVTPPLVTFSITKRIETDDSVLVHATDPSGIRKVGFLVKQIPGNVTVGGDSVSFGGSATDIVQLMPLTGLTAAITTFPRTVTVEAFAEDSIGNRGVSTIGSTPAGATATPALDTVTVVAGRTIQLPAGGAIGDAIYNRNRNELYLSNILLDRLEIFNVGTSTFVTNGIRVGSRPLGLAMWPSDTLGGYQDTVIVANSGGTNLSIVDVRTAVRTEARRHQLPNYEIEKVSIQSVDTSLGTVTLQVTQFDFSDRPQYVAANCRANCATVLAVYSTTPTAAQSSANRGYMAWENITAPATAPYGHFFWEIGTNNGADTLQVIAIRDTAPGQLRRDTVLGAAAGQTADFNQIVVQDTTFIRSSGDFNHSVMGEGGGTDLAFARAFAFDSRPDTSQFGGFGCGGPSARGILIAFFLKCTGVRDNGVSPGVYVRDFLVNRSSRVKSVATNFNGRTNFVRADSVYVMDFTLRQTGLVQVGGTNPGMDVNPNNRFDARVRGSGGFGGNASPNDRLMYVARPDANIEVFDSYWYGSVAVIPVRDPIIGPIRIALNALGQQVLVGVTANGVVVVPLVTAIVNPFPVPSQARSAR